MIEGWAVTHQSPTGAIASALRDGRTLTGAGTAGAITADPRDGRTLSGIGPARAMTPATPRKGRALSGAGTDGAIAPTDPTKGWTITDSSTRPVPLARPVSPTDPARAIPTDATSGLSSDPTTRSIARIGTIPGVGSRIGTIPGFGSRIGAIARISGRRARGRARIPNGTGPVHPASWECTGTAGIAGSGAYRGSR